MNTPAMKHDNIYIASVANPILVSLSVVWSRRGELEAQALS